MSRVFAAILLVTLVPTAARAEEPAPTLPVGEAGVACAPTPIQNAPASAAPDVAADERAFTDALEVISRRQAFTQRLIARREAEAFEQAIVRQARAEKLKRELSERERAISEREVEAAVSLYLKKRELTRELAARAKPASADKASAPASPGVPLPSTPVRTR